jgi:hypothetical protein
MSHVGRDRQVDAPGLERPVFIGGLARSGTTLMRTILGSHPDLAIPQPELPFWTHFFPRYGRADLSRPEVRRRLVEEMAGHRRFERLGVAFDVAGIVGALDDQRAVTLRTVFDAFMHVYVQGTGKPRWGVKEPSAELHTDGVFATYPAARMIHVIRDPRDVVVSRRAREGMASQHIASIVDTWRLSVRLARDHARRYEDAYLAVRYEDVVADPAAAIRRVCQVADVEYRPDMLAMNVPGWKGNNSSFGDIDSNRREISAQPVGRYVDRLPAADAQFVAMRARAELDDWGYEHRRARLSASEQGRLAVLMLQEAAWRTLSRVGLWQRAARVLGRQPSLR